MKKLSFVLPVYNVEPYLEKCIRSIRDDQMPYDDYEIIVINDGSPDNSKDIVERLQKEIPNIILINQKNAGVSAARNRGLKEAKGEYIVFIDPDDFVKPNLLYKLYNRAKKDNLDILLCGWSKIFPDGEIVQQLGYSGMEEKILNGAKAFYEKDKQYAVWDTCWGRLYKRKLIFDYSIDFPEGVIHLEDGVFVRKYFSLAERVGFENFDFYQFYQRPGSASRSNIGTSLKAAEGDITSAKSLLEFKNQHTLGHQQKGLINTSIIKYTLLPLMRAVSSKRINTFTRYKKMIQRAGLYPLETEHVPENSYLTYANAYNKSVWLFAIAYLKDLIKKKKKIINIKIY